MHDIVVFEGLKAGVLQVHGVVPDFADTDANGLKQMFRTHRPRITIAELSLLGLAKRPTPAMS